jgi:hypothetical protein
LAQYGGGYLLCLSASTFTFFNLGGGGSSYGTATGGIGAPTAVTISGVDYEYLTFNATGTLTIVSPGLFDVCLVAAGGGSASGNNTSYRGGGGGGGEIVQQTIYLTANATVTIGAGGAGGTTGIKPGYIGFSSVLGSGLSHVSATGGGGAPINDGSPTLSASGNGACGAGGLGITAGASAGLAFVDGTTGKNGGTGTSNGAGAGGGNSGAGSNGVSGGGGAGGAGTDISAFVGSSVTLAGGGGGSGSTGGAGGAGGGGAGGSSGAAGTAGNQRANKRAVMTSKKISKAKRQIGDQTTKGGVIGIMIYALSTNNVDPVLIGLLVPVASSVLAWVSTKIGDPDLACLFIPNDDDKPKN